MNIMRDLTAGDTDKLKNNNILIYLYHLRHLWLHSVFSALTRHIGFDEHVAKLLKGA